MKNYVFVYFKDLDWRWERCHYWFEAEEPIDIFETIIVPTKSGDYEGLVVEGNAFDVPPAPLGKQIISKKNIKRR